MRERVSHCCTRGGERDIFLGLREKLRELVHTKRTGRLNIAVRVIRERERAMLDSVRVRLTLWYTGLLALFLVLLSLVTYFIFWRSTLQRTDSNLAELSEAFLSTVRAEVLDNFGADAPRQAAQEAIVEHHYRDHVFAVLEPNGAMLASSQDLPNEAPPAGLLSSAAFHKLLADFAGADRLFENIKG